MAGSVRSLVAEDRLLGLEFLLRGLLAAWLALEAAGQEFDQQLSTLSVAAAVIPAVSLVDQSSGSQAENPPNPCWGNHWA